MKVLLIVDVQNDFCPGGSLAVENGDRIIPVINELTKSGEFDKIIATQDYHSKDHVSFASRYNVNPFEYNEEAEQTVWPDHCVQNTVGAELRPSLDQSAIQYIFRKGMDKEVDSYSAFYDNDHFNSTGLNALLSSFYNVEYKEPLYIYIVGIATEVCVLHTALDAKYIYGNCSVSVITDACASISEEGKEEAYSRMNREDIDLVESSDVLEKE